MKLDPFFRNVMTCAAFVVGMGHSAVAETVQCEGIDPTTKLQVTVRIRQKRSVGMPPSMTYLEAETKLGDRWLGSGIDVWLIRTTSGETYRGRLSPEEFALTFAATQSAQEMSATLDLDQGTVYPSRFSDLKCRVEGSLLYPLSPCPTGEVEAQSALLSTARSGSLRSLENLLGCGVSPNLTDPNGCSALHFVTDINCGKPSFSGSPNGHPQNPESTVRIDHRGRGSLNETAFITALAKAKADLNLVDRLGNSALTTSARNQQTDSVSVLLERGANVNLQDGLGNSALMYASRRADELMIRTLLSKNPDLKLKNRKGKTALDLANDNGHGYLADLLTPHSAQALITGNSDGSCSPVMIHLKKGQEVEVVLEAKTSQMFLLQSPGLGFELMVMPNGRDSKVIRPNQSGTFPFTCGVHGAPENQQTRGSFMVM